MHSSSFSYAIYSSVSAPRRRSRGGLNVFRADGIPYTAQTLTGGISGSAVIRIVVKRRAFVSRLFLPRHSWLFESKLLFKNSLCHQLDELFVRHPENFGGNILIMLSEHRSGSARFNGCSG